MVNRLYSAVQRRLNDPRVLWLVVCAKAVLVAIILVFLWAMAGIQSAPVYMKF